MIGVLGGTFDPVHFGHLRPALDVRDAISLVEVRLVPLKVAVHRAQPAATPEQRLAMVEAGVQGEPGLMADDRELRRDAPSYTFDTLVSLRAELGNTHPICLLVGEDAFNGFFGWHRSRGILTLAHLVIMTRPGTHLPRDSALRDLMARHACQDPNVLAAAPAGRIYHQGVTWLDISSTRIRELIAAGRSIRYLVPESVREIIARDGLYTPRTYPARRRAAGPIAT